MNTIDPKTESLPASFNFKSIIAEALFPRIRGKVLGLFMLNPEKQFYFRQATRIIGDSPASIQRELKSLTAAGILRMEPIGMQKFYRANQESPVFEELRLITRKTFGVAETLKGVLSPHIDKIQIGWISDSGATSGENEIVLILIGTLWVGDLASILEPVEALLRRPINPGLYDNEDFIKKCEADEVFLQAAVRADNVFIIGNQDELNNLIGR
jgi:hypothetical protein